jgi:hypothetical protein
VLKNGAAVFMLLGTDNNFEMLTLNQTVEIDEEDDETDDEEDELDFSMI